MLKIGPYTLPSNVLLAPMAGVSDDAFRHLCLQFGAGMATTEMISTKRELRNSPKTQQRLRTYQKEHLRSIQILGNNPEQMAETARYIQSQGANIVDINMGCPAKKVCRKAAGSALLKDEKLVTQILAAVIKAVDIPVTLKIRTGSDPQNRNALSIAHIAESEGIQCLTIHGRSRACRYDKAAEYATIAQVVDKVSIPVIANGDIDSPITARQVLNQTGACGIMIGRAAFGQPWLFQDIIKGMVSDTTPEPLTVEQKALIIMSHIKSMHEFYGEYQGLRIARKHIGWYLDRLGFDTSIRKQINRIDNCTYQLRAIETLFNTPADKEVLAA